MSRCLGVSKEDVSCRCRWYFSSSIHDVSKSKKLIRIPCLVDGGIELEYLEGTEAMVASEASLMVGTAVCGKLVNQIHRFVTSLAFLSGSSKRGHGRRRLFLKKDHNNKRQQKSEWRRETGALFRTEFLCQCFSLPLAFLTLMLFHFAAASWYETLNREIKQADEKQQKREIRRICGWKRIPDQDEEYVHVYL